MIFSIFFLSFLTSLYEHLVLLFLLACFTDIINQSVSGIAKQLEKCFRVFFFIQSHVSSFSEFSEKRTLMRWRK